MSEEIKGKVFGNEISIVATNLFQILLIILIGGLIYVGYTSLESSRKMAIVYIQSRHSVLEAQMSAIANSLRILDYNIAHPENRYPLDLPIDLFRKRNEPGDYETKP